MHVDQAPEGHEEHAAGLTKQEARRRALAARDALEPEDRERLGEAVRRRALELPELAAASIVMLFASFRSEIDTMPLAEWVLRSGRSLCLPKVLGPRTMAAFLVRDLQADLEPGKWDIPEPREGLPEVPPEDVDLVFVPGSAFDEEGRRCGYGGGFYDTFLPRTRPGTPRVAFAFEVQLVPRIIVEPHDLPVTAIVTERRVIRPG
ncbi:MAG: 5-formyltetrahydrofolate cyclo-ligase [Actinobacteria bacterium]|nr:5-formyltetrahydrofolate cyclo-ligase [Actinomycetota bacterium]